MRTAEIKEKISLDHSIRSVNTFRLEDNLADLLIQNSDEGEVEIPSRWNFIAYLKFINALLSIIIKHFFNEK